MSGILEDKEVGELWAVLYKEYGAHPSFRNPLFEDDERVLLIRKLVEERVNYYERYSDLRTPAVQQRALRDFGIDPETWK